MNEIMSKNTINELQEVQSLCKALFESPHYKKMGADGIFAIVTKAKSIGVNPIDALNGSMFYVQGKVELTAGMMNQLIRQAGHSITKDKRSDDTVCILHGKRKDNGDTWVESFSIEDAKLAGIYRNQWLKYPRDMLFARALSRLARQLFPEVIKGTYVQGEITDIPQDDSNDVHEVEIITQEQVTALHEALKDKPDLKNKIMDYLQNKLNITDFAKMPAKIFPAIIDRANTEILQTPQGQIEMTMREG